jgi:phosphocarrier protein HPr
MLEKEVTVSNEDGFHLRPIVQFLEIVKNHHSRVIINYNGKKVEAERVLDILKLCLVKGSIITLIVDGLDEEDVMPKLIEAVSGTV